MNIEKVTVFCASSEKCSVHFREAAGKLGRELANLRKKIYYGGGKVGLMGRLADSAIENGGEVIGVIPEKMYSMRLGHPEVTEMKIVKDIHEREKILMSEADCIFVLPGGIGTMEEFLQAISWKFLDLLDVPIILINISDYFEPLIKMLEKSEKEKFMKSGFNELYTSVKSVDEAILEMEKPYKSENNLKITKIVQLIT